MIKADLLLTNANVLTLDGRSRRAGSLAVKNGRISGIWPETEPPWSDVDCTMRTQILNLKGATVLPGFIETHNHLLMYAEVRQQVDCSSPLNQTISDIQRHLRNKAEQTPIGEWILGYGYDDTLLEEKRHPTRSDIDIVAPHHPVYIRHISGHLSVVNSAAMKLLGIDEGISDPQGGHFGRDHSGNLNGVLYEGANYSVLSKLPNPPMDKRISLLGEAAKDYVAQGITTSTDAAVRGMDDLEAHLKAAEQGINPLHMRLMILHHLLRTDSHFGSMSQEELDKEIRDRSNGRACLDSAKFFQDGSIQGLTGALRQPYHCEPDLYGKLIHEQEVFNTEVLDLHKRGYRITIHGNGDRAIGSILDAYENALKNAQHSDHRHRIEHVQTATVEDLNRMKELNVAGSFFVNHVYYWGDRHQRLFLGQERARRISPLREAIERDLLFTLHSDCPVTPISPLFSVWAAVNRLTREGQVLGAEQRCDVETALKSMTSYGAKLNFDEGHSGSIEVGKRADFAILAEDPTKIDPKEIKNIPNLATLIDGNIEYENGLPVKLS
jgi:predicted amidohydrolase YtcJ